MREPSSTMAHDALLEHLDWVRGLARHLAPDLERAQDVEQETWRLALEERSRVYNLKEWLAQVTRNAARQMGRSSTARTRRERVTARPEALPSTVELLERENLARELARIVSELDEPYREVLVLRYFEGLTPVQIGQRLGMPRNTVRSQLARGLTRVRSRLEATGGRDRWMNALNALAAGASASRLPWFAAGLAGAVGVTAVAVVVGTLWGGDASASARSGRSLLVAVPQIRGEADEESEVDRDSARQGVAEEASAVAASGLTGTMDLRVADSETGEPLQGHPYLLYYEATRGTVFLAEGVTDASGRAVVPRLPTERVVLLRTPRIPPHAPAAWAVWLEPFETEPVELSVGAGGSLVGRAVDGEGRPLEGIEVWAYNGIEPVSTMAAPETREPREVRQFAGHTGADGRFRVDYLTALPNGVWILDGVPSPERWQTVMLALERPGFGEWGRVNVHQSMEPGSVLDLGDRRLQTKLVVAGRVMDRDGLPLEGLLVSANPDRKSTARGAEQPPPVGAELPFWRTGSGLLAGDSITDAQGEFQLQSLVGVGPVSNGLTVWTPEGRSRYFSPKFEEPVPIELVFAPANLIELALVDEAGEPMRELTLQRGPSALLRRAQVEVEFHLTDDEFLCVPASLSSGGIARVEIDRGVEAVRAMVVCVRGYLPEFVETPLGLEPDPIDGLVRIGLTPLPTLEVELAIAPDAEVSEGVMWSLVAAPGGPVPMDRVGQAKFSLLHARTSWASGDDETKRTVTVAVNEPHWLALFSGGFYETVAFDVPAVPGVPRLLEVDTRDLVAMDQPDKPRRKAPESRSIDYVAKTDSPGRLRLLSDIGYANSPRDRHQFSYRLVYPDGAPLEQGSTVSSGTDRGTVGAEGHVELWIEGTDYELSVVRKDSSVTGYASIQGKGSGSVVIVKPCRSVVLDIARIPRPHAHLGFNPIVRAVGRGESWTRFGMSQLASPDPTRRRFLTQLSPGRYEVTGDNGLDELVPQTFDVLDVDGRQVVHASVQ